jgi:hypothetical protein
MTPINSHESNASQESGSVLFKSKVLEDSMEDLFFHGMVAFG